MARTEASARQDEAPGRCRFDKWLWAARFYKTRTLAAIAIDNGHARLNDTRVKPAHSVTVGASVQVRKQTIAFTVQVMALSDRRGSAQDAMKLYGETAESIAARELAQSLRRADAAQGHFAGRPTKRDRRKLEDFLNEP